MPKTNGNGVKGKNSTLNFAPNSAKTVPYKKFEVEKNAKNTAYHFILSHNLLDDFIAFSENYHSDNPHLDCINDLLNLINA